MNSKNFEHLVDRQFSTCKRLLFEKAKEYAPKDDDRLVHFRKSGALLGVSPSRATFCLLSKHLVSLAEMTEAGEFSEEKWDEKISDSINYLLLLKACVEEEREQKNKDK